MAPFHSFVGINVPNGDKKAFFVNMTCTESKVIDPNNPTWKRTTWSLDDSVEAIITDVMINRTKAITGGRADGNSNCWLYKNL